VKFKDNDSVGRSPPLLMEWPLIMVFSRLTVR